MKHLESSSSPLLPKRQSSRNSYVPTVIFASLLGTYAELFFVGKGYYEFSVRPFPYIFSINILFTLIVLPLFTWVFLYLANKMVSGWERLVFMIFLSLLASIAERVAVRLGLLATSEQWSHYYSFFGYFLFLVLVWIVSRSGKS